METAVCHKWHVRWCERGGESPLLDLVAVSVDLPVVFAGIVKEEVISQVADSEAGVFIETDLQYEFVACGNVVFNMFGGEDAGRQFVGCVIAGLQSLSAGIAADDAAQSVLFPRRSLERFLDSYGAAA